VGWEQTAPPRGQAGQPTARHRQQWPFVSVVRQLIEHLQPVPHRLPEDLTRTQNPVHRDTFPPSQPCPEDFRLTVPIPQPRPAEWGNHTLHGPALRQSDALGQVNGAR
jgi:hypothetical protein